MARAAEVTLTGEQMNELEELVETPWVWGRLHCGIRFEDLQERRYQKAIKLLKKHYLPEQVTYRSVRISEDSEGVEEFSNQALVWLKDKMSIAAVAESTDKLIGVLIMRVQEKSAFSRTFSRVKLTHNEKYAKVVTFNREVEKEVDLFEKLNVNRYFKIYVMAIKPKYRHKGLVKELLRSATQVCASAHVPALAGVFATGRTQEIAAELGFHKYKEIYYVRYLVDRQVVFWDTGSGNHGAALMAHRVPNVEEIQEQRSRFGVAADGDKM